MLCVVGAVWHRPCQIYHIEKIDRLPFQAKHASKETNTSLKEKVNEQKTIRCMAFGMGCAHSDLADGRVRARASRMDSIRCEQGAHPHRRHQGSRLLQPSRVDTPPG